MKQIYVLALIFFILNSYSQNCNIGNETLTGSFAIGSFGANFLGGVKFTLSQEGTLNSINLIGNDAGGVGVQMAVYDDNYGVPNNLIEFSSPGTVVNLINSFPVTLTLLPAGDYWIMAVYEFEGPHSYFTNEATGNDFYYQELTFGSDIPNNASDFLNTSDSDLLYFLDIDCGNTLSIFDNPLSVENFDLAEKISIYPNPASNFIRVSQLSKPEKYQVYNTIGQKIIKGIISENEKIDIQNLANGIYFLKFENGSTIKFLKEC